MLFEIFENYINFFLSRIKISYGLREYVTNKKRNDILKFFSGFRESRYFSRNRFLVAGSLSGTEIKKRLQTFPNRISASSITRVKKI